MKYPKDTLSKPNLYIIMFVHVPMYSLFLVFTKSQMFQGEFHIPVCIYNLNIYKRRYTKLCSLCERKGSG